MTVEHKLVVDFDGDAVFLDIVYLGTCTSVGVVANETVCGKCGATITLPQVTLKVLAKGPRVPGGEDGVMSGRHVYARPHNVVIDGESGMVLVDEQELCCDQPVVIDSSDRAGLLIVELRLVADSVTTILPLLPADGVREI